MTSFLVIRKTMVTVNLAQAKANLSELIDKVEGGEGVIITRHGRPVARISPIEQPKKPVRSLAAFRATVPRWGTSSAKLLRQMRDEQH
jgi:prevent-host-death family protein